ncbi:dTMP kinase [Adlercreutzia caecimuris]|uniref:dTMP kinase n=1 Tax=Adlercreutzia caecimuris TaxID=671266 RepID=UPI00242E46A7|nr:dTMP kinase [Adlercreutzia caecimuris]MCI9207637.1 dTMP kinase [Adlercreutzia caecimuris]
MAKREETKGGLSGAPACAEEVSAPAAPARGVFITFEGGDGVGKSTQIRFLARFLEEHGRTVLRLREPGGTAVGEALRRVVLDPAHGTMSDRAELLIYEAARAQIVDEVIKPALSRGDIVLCDRFYDSTVAYQGAGRGLDGAFIEAANRFACDGLAPDVTLLLAAPEATVRSRMERRGGADRLEQAGEAFHRRVADGFAAVAAAEPERVRTVRSERQRVATFRAVLAAVAPLLPEAAAALQGDGAALEALVDRVMEEKHRERCEQARKKRRARSRSHSHRGGAASGNAHPGDRSRPCADGAVASRKDGDRRKDGSRKGGSRKGGGPKDGKKGARRG